MSDVVAGVQPTLRLPIRMDMDKPKDEGVVRVACDVNFMQLLYPGTLGRVDIQRERNY
jgi:hypothetical protein